MKKILLLVILFNIPVSAQILKFGEARGLFFSVAVGPRIPIGDFSTYQNIGVGLTTTISYTDNRYLPIFLFAKFGYSNFPGNQNYYRYSDYSSLIANLLTINFGARFYFPPVIKNIVILMPIAEAGISYGYLFRLHEFKIDRNRIDYTEEKSKFGFNFGAGFSMFLMDVILHYNYFPNIQYLSFDLIIRIPIYVKI